MDRRQTALRHWLENDLGMRPDSLETASADASFRRYFRAHQDDASFIIMDAPPELEPIEQFLAVASALAKLGIHSPQIIAYQQQLGFILMEDLGDAAYLEHLSESPDTLYLAAIDPLIKLQTAATTSGWQPPSYSTKKLEEEMDLFQHWYLGRHFDIELTEETAGLWQRTKQTLLDQCENQPQVWVHRDFHSRNLIVTETESPGVIDFQDMVCGPLTYDLVSLLKDCYIQWPRARQLAWLSAWYEKLTQARPELDLAEQSLIHWFDMTGLQRHLKVLGIFCRLNYRDNKPQYLGSLPLVREYVLEVLALYPELKEFEEFFLSLPEPSLA